MTISLHLTGQLGTSLTIEVGSETQLLPTLRRYGRQGWTSGEIPAGGLVLPLAMAEHFDWSLIGARAYTSESGEQVVMYRGQSYKRRELDEVDTKKLSLPKLIKFSRGARPTDPEHLKEGEPGGVRYVTLVSFKGAGRVLEAYLDPVRPGVQPPQAQRQVPAEMPPVLRTELISRLQAATRRLKTTMNAVLKDLGVHQFVEVDDLTLAQVVARLENQAGARVGA